MLTRRQMITRTSAGLAVGLAGASLPATAAAAIDEHAVGSTPFTSRRQPSVTLTVPDGWFFRDEVVQGMDVPWCLVFTANEQVPWGLDPTGDWDDFVGSSLSPLGLAVAVMALDRTVPASSWLLPGATKALLQAGSDVGPSDRVGRPLSNGLTFEDLGSLAVTEPDNSVDPYIGWFDYGNYLVGVQAWVGSNGSRSVLEAILGTIRPEGSSSSS